MRVADIQCTIGVRRRACRQRQRWLACDSLVLLGGLVVAAVGFAAGHRIFGGDGFAGDSAGGVVAVEQRRLQDDLDMTQRRAAAVVLHCLGLLYIFVALAIVVNELLFPTLGLLATRLGLSGNVFGAMVFSGSSAPELFASFFGVLVLESDIGMGMIVGSLAFDFLLVTSFCVMITPCNVQRPVLFDLLPLLVDLLVLIAAVSGQMAEWWEVMPLLLLYIGGVVFVVYVSRTESSSHSQAVQVCQEPARAGPEPVQVAYGIDRQQPSPARDAEERDGERAEAFLSVRPPGGDVPEGRWLTYLLTLPIVGVLVLTVPDV